MTLTVATYNMGRTGTDDDLTELAAAGVTVVCLQEMSDRQGIRLPDGWQAYWPDAEPGQAATPIIYDARSLGDWRIAVGSRLMTPATGDLEDGAGGRSVKPKWANWIRLSGYDAEAVTVVNVHAIPTVQGRDGPIRSKPKRLAWHARHMAALADLVRELRSDGGLVVVAGDFNVAYGRDSVGVPGWPVRELGDAGLTCTFADHGLAERDTKDNRSIDYVFASRPSVGHRVLTGYDSDHRPLLASYELAELPPPRASEILRGDNEMQLTDNYTDGKTVGDLFRHLDRYMVNEAKRDEALRRQVARAIQAVNALPGGATKAELKGLLENLDATIVLTVNDPKPTAPPTGGQP